MKSKVVAIIGPSGTGKSALAEALCLQFNGEIVSTDSMQVYKGMDIGTNKELLKVPQHLLDIKNPGEKITVAEYQALAYEAIDTLVVAGKQPFLVGCSMLYAESVLNGYDFETKSQDSRYNCLKIGIAVDREELRARVAARTQAWLEQGLLKEIKKLLHSGVSAAWLKQCGQEYRYFTAYLLDEISLEEAIRKTNISINQYTKRQYTWWRRHADVQWLPAAEIAQEVGSFLKEA